MRYLPSKQGEGRFHRRGKGCISKTRVIICKPVEPEVDEVDEGCDGNEVDDTNDAIPVISLAEINAKNWTTKDGVSGFWTLTDKGGKNLTGRYMFMAP